MTAFCDFHGDRALTETEALMENYEVFKSLGTGTQGETFLCKSLTDGEAYSVKKIECIDESEANKSFRNVNNKLINLGHRFINSYTAAFVTWNHQIASIELCLATTFQQNGSLENYIKIKRSLSQPVEETVVKAWLGQMIEALIFLHDQNIVHRNIKPTNILINDKAHLVLTDISEPIALADHVTKTRAEPKRNWFAPETRILPCTQQNDVYDVGLIAISLVSTSIDLPEKDGVDMIPHQIIANRDVADKILKDVTKMNYYSDELIYLIKLLLNPDPRYRLSFRQLLANGYVSAALKMIESPLVKARRPRSDENGENSAEKTTEDIRPLSPPSPRTTATLNDESTLPVDLPSLISRIDQELDYENNVFSAMRKLEQLDENELAMIDEYSGKLLVRALKTHELSSSLVLTGLKVIRLSLQPVAQEVLFANVFLESSSLETLIDIAQNHPRNPEIRAELASIFLLGSFSEEVAKRVGGKGGIHALLHMLKASPSDEKMCGLVCKTIWNLSISKANGPILAHAGGLSVLEKSLRIHSDDMKTCEAILPCILVVAIEVENVKHLDNSDIISELLQTMHHHITAPNVIKYACGSLANFVELHELSLYKALDTELPDKTRLNAVKILTDAYKIHRDNLEVVQAICQVLHELAKNDDALNEFEYYKVDEIFPEIDARFGENEEIAQAYKSVDKRMKSRQ